jgi:hypothetical protein
MPEIAVDKDRESLGLNHYVRLAGQIHRAGSEAQTRRPQRFSQEQLGRRITRSHQPHDRGDLLRLSLHGQMDSK